jgi:ectoine hydroxylase-related dioxygenase (phytanoyl-CoA dioxygenase family)
VANIPVVENRRERLRRDGFVPLGRVLDEETTALLASEVERSLGRAPTASEYGVLRHNLWQIVPAFEDVLRRGELARIARELLGLDEVVLFQDHLVWKPPGAARVEWHQDYGYWPLEAPAGLTLWIALDRTDRENGCLHYLARTHEEGERAPQDFMAGADQPASNLPPLDALAREHEATPLPALAGDGIAHDPLVWHMSPANASDRDRRAWSITWIAPGNRWNPAHAPHPFNFELRPRPGEPVAGGLFPRFGAS